MNDTELDAFDKLLERASANFNEHQVSVATPSAFPMELGKLMITGGIGRIIYFATWEARANNIQ